MPHNQLNTKKTQRGCGHHQKTRITCGGRLHSSLGRQPLFERARRSKRLQRCVSTRARSSSRRRHYSRRVRKCGLRGDSPFTCKPWKRRGRRMVGGPHKKGGVRYTEKEYTKNIFLFGEYHDQPDDDRYIEKCIRNIATKAAVNNQTVDVYIEESHNWKPINQEESHNSKPINQKGGGPLIYFVKAHRYHMIKATPFDSNVRIHYSDIRCNNIAKNDGKQRNYGIGLKSINDDTENPEFLFKLFFEQEYWPKLCNSKYNTRQSIDDAYDAIPDENNRKNCSTDMITLRERMTKQLREFVYDTGYDKDTCIQYIYGYLHTYKLKGARILYLSNVIHDIYVFLRMFRNFDMTKHNDTSDGILTSEQHICIFLGHWNHCLNIINLIQLFFGKKYSYKLRGIQYGIDQFDIDALRLNNSLREFGVYARTRYDEHMRKINEFNPTDHFLTFEQDVDLNSNDKNIVGLAHLQLDINNTEETPKTVITLVIPDAHDELLHHIKCVSLEEGCVEVKKSTEQSDDSIEPMMGRYTQLDWIYNDSPVYTHNTYFLHKRVRIFDYYGTQSYISHWVISPYIDISRSKKGNREVNDLSKMKLAVDDDAETPDKINIDNKWYNEWIKNTSITITRCDE